jgi:hypothetical protein
LAICRSPLRRAAKSKPRPTLRRGREFAWFAKDERTIGEVIALTAGGAEQKSPRAKGELAIGPS